MPPRPTDPAGAEPRQHRSSTGLAHPDQASEARQLAEQLGNALECHRRGVETSDWPPVAPRGPSATRSATETHRRASGGLRSPGDAPDP